MLKVSLVAYLVGGAFQNLAYWDMPYYLFVAVAVTRAGIKKQRTLSRPKRRRTRPGREGRGSVTARGPDDPFEPTSRGQLTPRFGRSLSMGFTSKSHG